MLASGNEAIFEGSEIEGALRRRRRPTQGAEVAKTFSVSMPTIKRWLKRRRETGDVEPREIPGRPSRKGAMLKEWLPKHLEANDDLTLEEHSEAFEEEFGQRVSTSTIGRAIAGLPDGPWPLKKSRR
jgi:transposase